MTQQDFTKYAGLYKDALLLDVIPFWECYSMDKKNGGYFTCLDREGTIYDTDKFIWLQARQAWVFSMLYNELDPRKGWLETAKLGIEFLIEHGMAKSGDFYFAVNAFSLTGDQKIGEWYQKVHNYSWKHFPDPDFGEWYGYLNRQGQPHLTLKGGKWKGCFHVPRALFQCWQTFEKLANQV